MIRFFPLFYKELKDNLPLILFISSSIIATGLIALSSEIFFIQLFIAFFPVPITTVLIPFLLTRSFGNEWRSGTHLLLFSLPVPRYTVSLSKFACFLLFGLITFLLILGSGHYIIFNSGSSAVKNFLVNFTITPLSFWKIGFLFYFTPLFLFLTLAYVSESLKMLIKAFHFLIPITTFIVGMYLYVKLFIEFLRIIPVSAGGSNSFTPYGMELLFADFSTFSMFTFLFSVALLLFGSFIFERFTEV